MKDARGFLLFWVINSFILYFAPFVLVGLVVTGNERLTAFMASIVSGFLLTLFDASAQPTLRALNLKLKEDWQWVLVYLFVNVLGVWLIARYADLTGVGVASAWVAVLLGVVVNVAQWMSWQFAIKKKK